MLVSDLDCHYRVEWQTEYACPEQTLRQKNSCQLQQDLHGITFDLSHLNKFPGIDYPSLLLVILKLTKFKNLPLSFRVI